ncbi:uncharacterized protein [Littorina saxatilis]|uniref:uncharacterized protein n=1 Tax=Littorina saxatilis TaxID=31220 RepID=UPI0038B51501
MPRDTAPTAEEMAELREQMKEMANELGRQKEQAAQQKQATNDAAAAEINDLRERLAGVTEELGRQRMQPVSVQVVAPPQTPRLKTFTGFAPAGGNECDFRTWAQQMDSFLLTPDLKPCDPRILASLRGVAFNAVKDLTTNADIVAKIRSLFGCVEDTEAQLLAFAGRRLKPKEKPADFLLQLWGELLEINTTAKMEKEELQKKLYRTFCTGLQSALPLLALEMRNKFGFPGTAAPALDDLLLMVRRTAEMAPAPATKATIQSNVHQVEAPVNIDYDKLADKVAERLRSAPTEGLRSAPRGGKRLCFNCGVFGAHIARECRSPPNPAKVAEERSKMGSPLNGRQSMATGRR